MSDIDRNPRRQRLRFRSWHRGTREMDLLMGSFADRYVPDFTLVQLDEYEVILELADPDLYNWIVGIQALPPQHDGDVMRMLCTHRYVAS